MLSRVTSKYIFAFFRPTFGLSALVFALIFLAACGPAVSPEIPLVNTVPNAADQPAMIVDPGTGAMVLPPTAATVEVPTTVTFKGVSN